MAASERVFCAGEIIFAEGDPPTLAYLIESGQVEISSFDEGRRVVLAKLGPGQLLGEMAMIDNAPRTATATALSDGRLMPIDKGQIGERLAASDPIIRAIVEGQLKRYRGGMSVMRGEAGETAEAVLAQSVDLGIGKMRLDAQLRNALAERSLQVHYQPLLDIAAGRIVGYEALVRWQHPERGAVSPAEFISLAEETSLIVPVGEFVIDTAFEALTKLRGQDAGHIPPYIAVNVSARQLAEAGLIERIVKRAQDLDFPSHVVKIEITESRALDYSVVREVIGACHAAGICVALDDFGTGYSNLAHLAELAFDEVKVDQAFVRGMFDGPRSADLLEAIVRLVRAIGAKVVCEGVETEQQLARLAALEVDYAQGWLIGKPAALSDIVQR